MKVGRLLSWATTSTGCSSIVPIKLKYRISVRSLAVVNIGTRGGGSIGGGGGGGGASGGGVGQGGRKRAALVLAHERRELGEVFGVRRQLQRHLVVKILSFIIFKLLFIITKVLVIINYILNNKVYNSEILKRENVLIYSIHDLLLAKIIKILNNIYN